ncbi:hypothetical protein PSTG_16428 [Puccinia striiformis f. sp. tritici PST-78]|uniref:Uncharacterized protein n=1 Tax=Puccinia striiformis f. sp. tritici PST-78 TaxID=1165861 RepID=A0A0L0USU1_9BASI|nr:hypothetical protein PSTG_16428 [Puccinia striiformis f. sp. tritici PST-78]
MTSNHLVDGELLLVEKESVRPKVDTLDFAGVFLVSHTSDVSILNPERGERKELLAWGSFEGTPFTLDELDHREVRLFYKSGIIRRLLYGRRYWLSGAVLGNRFHEMPFLDCELEGIEASATQFMEHNGITLSGVGTITKIRQSRAQGNELQEIQLYVKHEVDEYTAFGDKIIIVRYHLENKGLKGRPREILKVGQRGAFGGILAGWSRKDRCLYAQVNFKPDNEEISTIN